MGQVEQRSLRAGETVRLDIPDGQLHTLDLRVTKGAAQVVTQNQEPLETAAGAPAPGISVTRRYLVDGQEAAAIKSSDTIFVEISVVIDNRGVDGCYIVTDHLPAGMHARTCATNQPNQTRFLPARSLSDRSRWMGSGCCSAPRNHHPSRAMGTMRGFLRRAYSTRLQSSCSRQPRPRCTRPPMPPCSPLVDSWQLADSVVRARGPITVLGGSCCRES